MNSYLIAFLGLWSVASAALDMCTFEPPKEEIDWSRVPRGPWTWAAHSVDELQDILRCSSVVIEGEGKAENSTFMMRMTYGSSGHQRYTMHGDHVAKSEYHMSEFTSSWRNIVFFTKDPEISGKLLKEEMEIPRKSNIMFYTDYKNYFISAICMPNGKVSVAALTTLPRARRLLLSRIYGVLVQHKVMAIPARVDCRFVGNEKDRY